MSLYDLAKTLDPYIEIVIVDHEYNTRKSTAANVRKEKSASNYNVINMSPLNDDQILVFIL